MYIEPIDYHDQFISEGSPFYNDLNKLNDKNSFNSWVKTSFNRFTTIHSFCEVLPTVDTIIELKRKGYIHRSSQCHYSAKATCLLLNDSDYITGYIKRSDWHFPIITHSFNFLNGRIIDMCGMVVALPITKPGSEMLSVIMTARFWAVPFPLFVIFSVIQAFSLASRMPLLFSSLKFRSAKRMGGNPRLYSGLI